MRFYIFLCVFFTIISVAALGHDTYLAYFSREGLMDIPFKFSDIGWLLVNYAPDFHDFLRNAFSAETWETQIKPLLEQTAFFVSLVPTIILYVYIFVAKSFSLWPFYEFKGDPRLQKDISKKKKVTKYKRK